MPLAVLVAYEASGQGWVGWVVLAVILLFLAFGFFSLIRGWVRTGRVKWRSRQQREQDRQT
ncbi:MAG TPA: hypothetical protein VMF35_00795 [Acidimicrobiales bacterium]|nr:hypothetical protein [Acidimicrobiales bacterium]